MKPEFPRRPGQSRGPARRPSLQPAAPPRTPTAPARTAAYQILLRVAQGKGNSDSLLRSSAIAHLEPRDRNLTTTLVMGVLRWQLLLEERLRPLLDRPGQSTHEGVQTALLLGAFQLLFLDRVPAHAILFDSVELARLANPHAAGMVNAVLRRLAETVGEESKPEPTQAEIQTANPAWLIGRWQRAYGSQITAQLCRANQQPPVLNLRLTSQDVLPQATEQGLTLTPPAFLFSAATVEEGDPAQTSLLRNGAIRIQDEASQLVAELASVALVVPPTRILDCCAAPGGKTAILTERNPGVPLWACDSNAERLKAMQKRMQYIAPGTVIEYVHADAVQLSDHLTARRPLREAAKPGLPSSFDLILCDVPCSGTGTLAGNPEIRHRLTSQDLLRQQARQTAILTQALALLAPGGRLIYSTCSLEPEENEQVIDLVLHDRPEFSVEPVLPLLQQLETSHRLVAGAFDRLSSTAISGNHLRTVPGLHPVDGFFAAVLTRRSLPSV